jgi:AI-2 transport protein TqsA
MSKEDKKEIFQNRNNDIECVDQQSRNLNHIKIFLGIIVMVIAVYILRTLKGIFIPLTFAIFLSIMFQPLNRFLHDRKIPIWINILLMVIIILILFSGMGTIVYTSVSSFVTEFPKYEKQISSMLEGFFITFEIPVEEVTDYLTNKVNWLQLADRMSLSKIISGTMGNFIDFMVKLLLTVAFMIFIVLERTKIFERINKVITEDEAAHSNIVTKDIERSVKTFIVNKTLISMVTGLISMIFIAIFGVDFVVISGFLIFILNYIPNFGSIVASGFPILICFLQYGLSWQLIAITATLIGTQMTIGNFIEPKVMGNELKLSPLVVLLSLIFWFWVWGPVGMILAVPITSAMNLILKEIPSMRVVSAIISSE